MDDCRQPEYTVKGLIEAANLIFPAASGPVNSSGGDRTDAGAYKGETLPRQNEFEKEPASRVNGVPSAPSGNVMRDWLFVSPSDSSNVPWG